MSTWPWRQVSEITFIHRGDEMPYALLTRCGMSNVRQMREEPAYKCVIKCEQYRAKRKQDLRLHVRDARHKTRSRGKNANNGISRAPEPLSRGRDAVRVVDK